VPCGWFALRAGGARGRVPRAETGDIAGSLERGWLGRGR